MIKVRFVSLSHRIEVGMTKSCRCTRMIWKHAKLEQTRAGGSLHCVSCNHATTPKSNTHPYLSSSLTWVHLPSLMLRLFFADLFGREGPEPSAPSNCGVEPAVPGTISCRSAQTATCSLYNFVGFSACPWRFAAKATRVSVSQWDGTLWTSHEGKHTRSPSDGKKYSLV